MDQQPLNADNQGNPPPPVVNQVAQQAAPQAPAARAAVAPHLKRSRFTGQRDRGNNSTEASAMLEVVSRLNMFTVPRHRANRFVPDANVLFHTLGICDALMNNNEQFLSCTPAWIPIVSQLYIAMMWFYMILFVHQSSGYGPVFGLLLKDMDEYLHLQDCLIPGPLVPFFQSLAAVNGHFEWIGDVFPVMPDFHDLWHSEFFVQSDYSRLVPIPAILLDQLHYFSTWQPGANQQLYTHFEWYRNVFGQGFDTHSAYHHVGPQHAGSLYTPSEQLETAHQFWEVAFAQGITRVLADGDAFTDHLQLFGIHDQRGAPQIDWFQHVASAMQKYALHFTGSVPLKSISPIGLGACLVQGVPEVSAIHRNWLYPPDADITPFVTCRLEPRRPVPAGLHFQFSHCDHNLEEQAEQYAILCHTNIRWGSQIDTQHEWPALNPQATHTGALWSMNSHRRSPNLRIHNHFAQLINAEYYVPEADYED